MVYFLIHFLSALSKGISAVKHRVRLCSFWNWQVFCKTDSSFSHIWPSKRKHWFTNVGKSGKTRVYRNCGTQLVKYAKNLFNKTRKFNNQSCPGNLVWIRIHIHPIFGDLKCFDRKFSSVRTLNFFKHQNK